MAPPPTEPTEWPETFWHLSTSILQDPAFQLQFADFWAALLHGHPPQMAAITADWWELVAKSACHIFCPKLSKLLTLRCREKIFFKREALQAAFVAADWPVVASIGSRLKEEDCYWCRGAVLWACLPIIPGEEKDIFAMAADSKQLPLAAT